MLRNSPTLAVALLIACLTSVNADIPRVISYQGVLTENDQLVQGDTQMAFSILSSGGVTVWNSGTMNVEVSNGLFSVTLGPLPQGVTFDDAYSLKIQINPPSGPSTQTPLTSVAYSFNAVHADSSNSTALASMLRPGVEIIGSITTGTSAALKATNTANTGETFGLYGTSQSTVGRGVYGEALAATGTTYGVRGKTLSTSGRGVYGEATASPGIGVYGKAASSTADYAGYFEGNTRITGNLTVLGMISGGGAGMGDITAVYAGTGLTGGGEIGDVTVSAAVPFSLSGSNANPIISGTNTGAGPGVKGTTSSTAGGVWGTTSASTGRGVYGEATTTTGTNYGVYGKTSSTSGYAGYFDGRLQVQGNAGLAGNLSVSTNATITGSVTAANLTATAANADPIISGTNTGAGPGVKGTTSVTTGTTYGVHGTSASTAGRGVFGEATAASGFTYGVYASVESSVGTAIQGGANASTGSCRGVFGFTKGTTGTGVRGEAQSSTGANFGVYGRTSSSSGYGVYYSGGLGLGGSGSMRNIVRTSEGPTALYAQLSAESWFEDLGSGRLVNGRTHIELDPLFLETVTIGDSHPMHVFIQLRGDCKGTYVVNGTTGFNVVELQNGTSDVEFSYRVMAKRKGYETHRLDYCKAAENDPFLYPEARLNDIDEGAAAESYPSDGR